MTDVNTLVTIVSCAITAIVLGSKALSKTAIVQKLEASSLSMVDGVTLATKTDSQALTTAIENELSRLHSELASFVDLGNKDMTTAYNNAHSTVLAEISKLNNALTAAHAKAVADVSTVEMDVSKVETAAKAGVAAAQASLDGVTQTSSTPAAGTASGQ